MEYIILFVLLFALEIAYFKIAERFRIVDLPNDRSAHTTNTIRGGGIVFYVGILLYSLWYGFPYPWFFAGLSLICLISFIDDLSPTSVKLRLLVHLIAVLLLFQQAGVFDYGLLLAVVAAIVAIGMINAYNFMDGINGMTALNSAVLLSLFWIVNKRLDFIDNNLIWYALAATIVFGFFNFRKNAKCFAGDIGSVGMSFIVLFLVVTLIVRVQNPVYILFFAVYGADVVWTIFLRMLKKENIFEAHKTHLYQYLSNEAGYNQLSVSTFYSGLQFGLGLSTIWIATQHWVLQLCYAFCVIVALTLLYFATRRKILSGAFKVANRN